MATPREIYIYKDCALEIEIDASRYHGIDYTDSALPWKYTVTNVANGKYESTQTFEGWLSPTAAVTLPPMIKQRAGIPKEAASYAFMYPPKGLAGVAPDDVGIQSAATLGGFVYFDISRRFICINALSLGRSERKLKFSGPFDVKQSASDELHKLGRAYPLQLDIFNEIGYVSYAWVRPGENLQFQSVLVGDKHPNRSGTMVFFQENGSGVAYAVDPSGYTDPTGYGGILSDAIQRIGQSKLTRQTLRSIYEIRIWRDRIKNCSKHVSISNLTESLTDKKSLLHTACHASLGYDFILGVLENIAEKPNLLHQDSYGWNPLHYACRFSPKDSELIRMLAVECPDAVVQSDNNGRTPLHISCNSDTCEEVIHVLIKADTSWPKITISKKTRSFGLLPIHLACYNGLSVGILNALLAADRDGETSIEKSSTGQLPLHIAIMKKLPADMVKALLDADSKINMTSIGTNFVDEGSPFDSDIYQSFNGKLPLHLACTNNSSSEIVQLLIEKDDQNTTIHEKVNIAPQPGIMQATRNNMITFKSTKFLNSTGSSLGSLTKSGASMDLNGIVALHLAMRHGVPGVINLLLRKEMEKGNNGSYEHKLPALCMIDSKGRTPLHIACENNVSPKIIQFLLKLDACRETTCIIDNQGFMPIHYACQNNNTNVETIDFLLGAEDTYGNNLVEGVAMRRSTHTGDTERGRTPLFLAVKSNSSVEVIERLLKSENFYLHGLDDVAMSSLADIIKTSGTLQKMIIDRLSERAYFSALMLELIACVWALTCFMIGTIRFRTGHISKVEPALLVLPTIVFMTREVLQILSVGSEYIGDLWSWFEIVSIALTLATSAVWFEEAARPGNETPNESHWVRLSLTAFFLILQFIIYLRSTFLPFARFVGGLLMILAKLFPFLVVSILLIFAFVYSNWVKNETLTLSECAKISFQYLFEFDPDKIGFLNILFGFLIVIILLNVVIAIVGEAWGSALEKSTQMFWQFRLDKIYELRYVVKVIGYFDTSTPSKFRTFKFWMTKIDGVRNISFGSDVSWTQPPFVSLTEINHYYHPEDYFAPDFADKIYDTHSLESDLYWAEIDGNLTLRVKIFILRKWFCRCASYLMMIIFGIPTCGLLWPQRFRAGLLSLGLKHKEEEKPNVPTNSDKKKS